VPVDAQFKTGAEADRPLPNTYWVIPGRLLAGEHPAGIDVTASRARLARLHAAGIDTFVDLTEKGEMPAYRQLLPTGTLYLHSAIVDTRVPNNIAQTRELLADIQHALDGDRGVYVHCRAGIGRTGLIVGCFLADQQANGGAAIKLLNRLWRQSERAHTWPTVPQTAEQADYIRHWPKLGKL
jgi:Protein-tyrosine phosphatase